MKKDQKSEHTTLTAGKKRKCWGNATGKKSG